MKLTELHLIESDNKLRQLEKTFERSGSDEDLGRLIHAQQRAGVPTMDSWVLITPDEAWWDQWHDSDREGQRQLEDLMELQIGWKLGIGNEHRMDNGYINNDLDPPLPGVSVVRSPARSTLPVGKFVAAGPMIESDAAALANKLASPSRPRPQA